MRGLTSTIALAAVLLGLVGYIYFVDSKKPASGAEEAKAKAFTVDADQIEEIQIKPASGESSRAERTSGTWELVGSNVPASPSPALDAPAGFDLPGLREYHEAFAA